VARASRSRRTLEALLIDSGVSTEVEDVAVLAIGWPGRRGGAYRDDDGTHARVRLRGGLSVVYREYATTSRAASRYRMKEAFVFECLRRAGLPTPQVLAATDGIEAGAPPAMLLADPGGSPLEEHVTSGAPGTPNDELWAEVGRRLRQLHALEVGVVGPLADPSGQRPWMQLVPYFAKALRQLRKRQPELAATVDDLLALLGGPVAARLEGTAPSICCGHYALPGLMLQAVEPAAWTTKSWLSLGYYVSVGDPDRDLTAVSTLCRLKTGSDLPSAFYAAYGRRPDPVAEVVYDAYLRRNEPHAINDAVTTLRALLG
jgi:hypothetical protein